VTAWSLAYDGYDPAEEGQREALCTLGNGFFATRGAAPESRVDSVHNPGTYVAGCYNRLADEIAGHLVENESMVNLPNWLMLTFAIDDGPWFELDQARCCLSARSSTYAAGYSPAGCRFATRAGVAHS